MDVIHQAVSDQLCACGIYHRGTVILAPHFLYEWQGQAYVDAVVLERSGGRPSEAVSETFAVGALHALATISETVTLVRAFDPRQPRYRERTIATLDA